MALHRVRAGLGAAAAGFLLVLTAPTPGDAVRALSRPDPSAAPSEPLVAVLALAAQLLVAWLLLAAVVTAAGHLPGAAGRAGAALARVLAPRAVRRAVELSLGLTVTVALGAGPALAAAPGPAHGAPAGVAAPGPSDPATLDLDWPDTGPATPAPVSPAPLPRAAASSVPGSRAAVSPAPVSRPVVSPAPVSPSSVPPSSGHAGAGSAAPAGRGTRDLPSPTRLPSSAISASPTVEASPVAQRPPARPTAASPGPASPAPAAPGPAASAPAASEPAAPAPAVAEPTSRDDLSTASPRLPMKSGPSVVVVVPGDTLWDLAERSLRRAGRPPPADAQIAVAWPQWWAANRDAVGDDPDLLLPGTVLVPPPPA